MWNSNWPVEATLLPAPYHTESREVDPTAAGKKPKITGLKLDAVLKRTGSSRTSTYARMDPKSKYYDPTFPKQIRISANRVVWIESEIDAWLESRVTASRN